MPYRDVAVCVDNIVVVEDVVCCDELAAELYKSGFSRRDTGETYGCQVGHFSFHFGRVERLHRLSDLSMTDVDNQENCWSSSKFSNESFYSDRGKTTARMQVRVSDSKRGRMREAHVLSAMLLYLRSEQIPLAGQKIVREFPPESIQTKYSVTKKRLYFCWC
jgi:hypothetical protein